MAKRVTERGGAIFSFVHNFVAMLTKFRRLPGSEGALKMALREAPVKAVVPSNRQEPTKRVSIAWRCDSGQIRITIRDVGPGFGFNKLPDPTSSGTIDFTHSRGTRLTRVAMDEVRFEEHGSVVQIRKPALQAEPHVAGSETVQVQVRGGYGAEF